MQQANNVQNDEILNNIIGPSHTKHKQEDDTSISVARVISIRYKVYFFVVAIIIGYLVYSYAIPSYDAFFGARDKLTNIQFEISTFEAKKTKFNADMALVEKIAAQEELFVQCINTNVGCEQLDPMILANSGFVKDFVQLGNLYNEKMIVDEKIILTNIDSYLTKLNPNNPNTLTKNGAIKKIDIGDPEVFTKNTYHVPMELTITFKSKDGLLSFINNAEKNIMIDKGYRILYKIDEISYNIVDYTKEQDVTLRVSAYYFQI